MSSGDRDRDRKNANSLLKQRFRGRHRRDILNSLMMTTTTTTTMMMMMMMVGDGEPNIQVTFAYSIHKTNNAP